MLMTQMAPRPGNAPGTVDLTGRRSASELARNMVGIQGAAPCASRFQGERSADELDPDMCDVKNWTG